MICSKIIMQGDQYIIPITIKYNGDYIDITNVKAIQIMIGELVKYYKNDGVGEISYNNETKEFYFPLTQEETFNMSGSQDCQVRIKFENDEIRGTSIGAISLTYSKTKEQI